jgi:hypothetical protein
VLVHCGPLGGEASGGARGWKYSIGGEKILGLPIMKNIFKNIKCKVNQEIRKRGKGKHQKMIIKKN